MLSCDVFSRLKPAVRVAQRALLCAALLLSAPLAVSAAAASAATPARPDSVQSRTPALTSAAQMGVAPKRSHKKWIFGGLGLAVIGGVAVLAGGGSAAAPAVPIGPAPPPPAPAR